MKKLITLTGILLLAISFSFGQQIMPAGEQEAVGRARAALAQSDCIGTQGALEYHAMVSGTCLGGGNSFIVHFYKDPCPPNTLCTAVLIPIGRVEVDCEGNATVISCGIISTQ